MRAPLQEFEDPAVVPLTFSGPLVIAGGGRIEPGLLRAVSGLASGFVGADSGGDALMAAGISPDAVIGDMDSVIDQTGFPPTTRVIALADQDTTDFEKCLAYTRAPVTIALGMTGGRFDHTLAALHAVARYAPSRRIVLVDECDLALGVSGSIGLDVGANLRISIYPLGRTAFESSTGLEYRLDGLVLEQGSTIGTSNRSIAHRIEIKVAHGRQSPWLLVAERGLLPVVLGARDGAA